MTQRTEAELKVIREWLEELRDAAHDAEVAEPRGHIAEEHAAIAKAAASLVRFAEEEGDGG